MRVWSLTLDPGQRQPWHQHLLPYLIVPLTEGKNEMTFDDGRVRETHEKPGEVIWREPGIPHELLTAATGNTATCSSRSKRARAQRRCKPTDPRVDTHSRIQELAHAKQQITSAKIRQPSGHFSHATMVEARGRIVFISGMTSRRADGTIAGIGDIDAQTRQVCENLKAAVEQAGGTMDDICRVDVYVRNMEHFEQIHKVRREYFRRRRRPRPWSRFAR